LQDANFLAQTSSKERPQNEQPPTQKQDWRSHASIIVASWEGIGMFNDDFNKPFWNFVTSVCTPL
jgi:hypothetical protein